MIRRFAITFGAAALLAVAGAAPAALAVSHAVPAVASSPDLCKAVKHARSLTGPHC
jgi:hypothetical protein